MNAVAVPSACVAAAINPGVDAVQLPPSSQRRLCDTPGQQTRPCRSGCTSTTLAAGSSPINKDGYAGQQGEVESIHWGGSGCRRTRCSCSLESQHCRCCSIARTVEPRLGPTSFLGAALGAAAASSARTTRRVARWGLAAGSNTAGASVVGARKRGSLLQCGKAAAARKHLAASACGFGGHEMPTLLLCPPPATQLLLADRRWLIIEAMMLRA